MDRKGALWYHVYPIILLVIDPCCDPLRPGLLLHPYGWLTRQLQLAAQVPYASFRKKSKPEKLATEALLGRDASGAAALPGRKSVGLRAQASKRRF